MEHRHLFLDLHDLTRVERLHRRVHQPQRHADNPILRGDNPWETVASLYGTVLYDAAESRFRMWYLTGPYRAGMVQVRGRQALGNITLLGYATSEDGVRWDKPVLNQLDIEGSTANNLIDVGRTNCEGFAVLFDEDEPDPQRRYKGFYWEHGGTDTFVTHEDGRVLGGEGEGDGMWLSYSPDGVHWTNSADNPLIPLGSDTTQSLVWDPMLGKYVVFGRFGAGGRKVARAESADCVHFDAPQRVFKAALRRRQGLTQTQLAERLGREARPLSPEALAPLTPPAGPGNIRELRNVLEQASVLASGEAIEVSDLNLNLGQASGLAALGLAKGATFSDAKRETIETFERDFLLRALRENDGNVARTAQSIGMVRQSLQQKIRELDLRSEDWGNGRNGNGHKTGNERGEEK